MANSSKDSPLYQEGQATLALHYGQEPENWTHNALMPPVYLTTTFAQMEPGQALYEYSRSGNPTRTVLEGTLASLESAEYALTFSSGLGAVTVASYLLKKDQHVLCCDDVYGGTNRFFAKCASRMGISITLVDGCVIENWTKEFRDGETKMVWIESPTNPTLKIVDIKRVCQAIKARDPKCIIVVDNTFMTPILQKPLGLGADIVLHSCTKYLNGHSDVVMGCLVTRNEKLYEKLKFFQNALGIVPSIFDCYLVTRSLKTLKIRILQQQSSALEIAQFLESNKYIEKVVYPGLKSHPQHEIANKQCSGYGAMMSIYLKMVTGDESRRLVKSVKIFQLAESLGCVCSLLEIPSLMTHTSVPEEQRVHLGINDSLVRISVGLEDVEDLIIDLEKALDIAFSPDIKMK